MLDDLDSPSGIAWREGRLYVANHDELLTYDYELGAATVTGDPKKLMDLPPAGNHWMRNITLSPDGKKIFVAVGSASNIGENGMEAEEGRATIWEYDLGSGRQRMFATGLRNANGLDWSPWSGELWTTVNERDMLGSDLVPDYLTNVPVGANYGWPWVYYKDTIDQRVTAPMPAYTTEYSRRPEFAMGPHVAALGLVFSKEGSTMGEKFSNGAFVARHGSWNRKPADRQTAFSHQLFDGCPGNAAVTACGFPGGQGAALDPELDGAKCHAQTFGSLACRHHLVVDGTLSHLDTPRASHSKSVWAVFDWPLSFIVLPLWVVVSASIPKTRRDAPGASLAPRGRWSSSYSGAHDPTFQTFSYRPVLQD